MLRFSILLLFCARIQCQLRSIGDERGYTFIIKTTWNGEVVPETEQVQITLKNYENSNDLILIIDAPYYDDPAPDGAPNEPFISLWDYEVVQAFFLNDRNQYLELEIGPHGQHLVLLYNGKRNTIRHSLPLEVRTSINGLRWIGEVIIPGEYFPPQVTKFNAYASHGVGSWRQHLALYPADGSTAEPDIHNLALFQSLNFKSLSNLLPEEDKKYSSLWEAATEGIFKYQITKQWNGFQTNIPPTIVTLQGFQDGVEVNFTMPSTVQFYPPHSFVIAIENDAGEAIKIQLFADGDHLIDFLVNRDEKINLENPPLDYVINTKIPGVIAGSAIVPPSYFPPMGMGMGMLNTYVLFGNERMLAMSLNPVDIDLQDAVPDINSLEHFSQFDFNMLANSNIEYSNVWRSLLDLPLVTELHHRTPTVIDFRNNKNAQKAGRKDLADTPEETVIDLKLLNQNKDNVAVRPTESKDKVQRDGTMALNDVTNTDDGTKNDEETEDHEDVVVTEEYETTTENINDVTTETADLNGIENFDELGTTTEPPNEKDSEVTQSHFGRPFRYLLKRRENTPERDEHQRRYEESDSKPNELPITFEITIKSVDKAGDLGQRITVDTHSKTEKDETPLIEKPIVKVSPGLLEEVVTPVPATSEDIETTTVQKTFEVPKVSSTTLIPEIPEIKPLPTISEIKEPENSDGRPELADSIPAEQNSAIFKIPPSPGIPEHPESSLFPDITEIPDNQVISIFKNLGLHYDSSVEERPTQPVLPSLPEKGGILQHKSELPDFLDAPKSQLPDRKEDTNKVVAPGITDILVPADKVDVISSGISDTTENVNFPLEILPPPHPLCFEEGLVPDEIRCQIFYECVIENGRWEVYSWRCKRGFYYDPETVACLRGFC